MISMISQWYLAVYSDSDSNKINFSLLLVFIVRVYAGACLCIYECVELKQQR